MAPSLPQSAAPRHDEQLMRLGSACAAGGGVTVGMRGGSGNVLQNAFHILTDGNARAPAVPQVPEPAEVPTESELTRLRNQWFNGALILPDPLSETYGLRIVQ